MYNITLCMFTPLFSVLVMFVCFISYVSGFSMYSSGVCESRLILYLYYVYLYVKAIVSFVFFIVLKFYLYVMTGTVILSVWPRL